MERRKNMHVLVFQKRFFLLLIFLLMGEFSVAQRAPSFFEKDFAFAYCKEFYTYKFLHNSKELFSYEEFFMKSLQHFKRKKVIECDYYDYVQKKKIATKSVFIYQYGYLTKRSVVDYRRKTEEETTYTYDNSKLSIFAKTTITKKSGYLLYRNMKFHFDRDHRMVAFNTKDGDIHQDSLQQNRPKANTTSVNVTYNSSGDIESVAKNGVERQIIVNEVDSSNMENIFEPIIAPNTSFDNRRYKILKYTSYINQKIVDVTYIAFSDTDFYQFQASGDTRVYYSVIHLVFEEAGKLKSIYSMEFLKGDLGIVKEQGPTRTFNAVRKHNVWQISYSIFGNNHKVTYMVKKKSIVSVLSGKSLIMQIK